MTAEDRRRNDSYLPCVIVPNALSPEECLAVRTSCVAATAGTVGERRLIDGAVRRSTIRWIARGDGTEWLYARLERIAESVNAAHYGFTIGGFDDAIQLAEYSAGDHYRWHQDAGAGAYSRRKLSLSVVLSAATEYEGGDLELWTDLNRDAGAAVRYAQGTLIAFPSYQVHRVTPVTSGCRYSIVAWLAGPPYR